MLSRTSERFSAPQSETESILAWQADIARAAAHWSKRSRRSDALDLAQEANVALLATHRNNGSLPVRLAKVVVRNAIVSTVRSDVRRATVSRYYDEAQFDLRMGSEPGPELSADRADLCLFVRDWLRLQPDPLRRLYYGLYVEGRSQAEMAEILSITEARVSQLVCELLRRGAQGLHRLVA
jgi:RNA polymerase sigma factor (sigma-70 family)